jgi:thioredoxin-related protein
MKIIVLFFLFLSTIFAITADDAAWLIDAQRDVDKAYAKAMKEKRDMVLLVVVKDGCSWCELMVHETLKDAEIQRRLSDMVIVVRAYGEKLPEGLETSSTPTMFFLSARTKKVLLKQVGYVKKGSFMIDITTAEEMLYAETAENED